MEILLLSSLALNVYLVYKAHKSTGLATIDSLSGLHNRRQFDSHFNSPLRREHDQRVLILMDIDKFKVINDTKGHAAGDRVIKKIGQIIRGSIRSTDCAYRIGGDEFAILSDSTHVMDRVKTGFEANGLNVSIGYAEFTTKDNRIQVYEQVDHALYKDKSLHNLYT